MSRTSDLLIEIERLTQENDLLRAENNSLRPLHAAQQSAISRLTRELRDLKEDKALAPTDHFHA